MKESLTFTPEEHPVSGSLSVLSDLAKSPKYEFAQFGTLHSALVTVSLASVYCDNSVSNVYGAQHSIDLRTDYYMTKR